jgi:hypothetical protein
VTALQRFGAAYMTLGLSVRSDLLAELDRRDDETNPIPPYVGAHAREVERDMKTVAP